MSDRSQLPAATFQAAAQAELVKMLGWVAESDLWSSDRGWVSPAVRANPNKTVLDVWIEADLSAARLDSSQLFDSNEFAIGATDSRRNYAVGDGLQYKATSADPKRPASENLLADLQSFLDLFAEVNALPELESETVLRVDRDGDAALRLFPNDDGIARIRFVNADAIKSPAEGKATGLKGDVDFGVETSPDDAAEVLAYWIDYGDEKGPQRVEEKEVVLVKPVGDSSIPRGVPVYWPVADNLRRCEDLLYAMSSTAKLRAKIGMIWKLANLSRAVESDLKSRLLNGQQVDASGNAIPVSVEQYPFGAIVRVPKDTEVEMPSSSIDAAGQVEILQAELRAVAVRMNMPEWLFSGMADAKYSNALVVEAPALKSFQALQRMLTTAFGTGRFGARASLAWRAVRLAVAAELLSQETLSACKVTCTAPTIVVRNKAEEAQTHATLTQSGIESVETAQRQLGLDPAEETARGATALPKFTGVRTTADGTLPGSQPGLPGAVSGQ